MATTDIKLVKKDVISPNLKEAIPATNGRYFVQNVWEVDSTTMRPVGMKQEITLTE